MIQSSHPVCNTIMLCGVIICLTSVVLLGIDGRFVDPDTYPTVRSHVFAMDGWMDAHKAGQIRAA